jgi:hypothetical protein
MASSCSSCWTSSSPRGAAQQAAREAGETSHSELVVGDLAVVAAGRKGASYTSAAVGHHLGLQL